MSCKCRTWWCVEHCENACVCVLQVAGVPCNSSRWQDIAHRKFARTILDEKLDKYNEFLRKIILSDEAAFHISGKVHKQNVHIWGSEYSGAAVAHIRDSPTVNIWCGLLRGNLIGPFVPKQLWHPPVSWMCWESWDLFPVGLLKSCLSNSGGWHRSEEQNWSCCCIT